MSHTDENNSFSKKQFVSALSEHPYAHSAARSLREQPRTDLTLSSQLHDRIHTLFPALSAYIHIYVIVLQGGLKDFRLYVLGGRVYIGFWVVCPSYRVV